MFIYLFASESFYLLPFRLREAEKPDSSLTFPRFGSKLRYSDNTLSKKPKPINRPPPYFDQKHAGKGNQAHSVDNCKHLECFKT